MQLGLHGIGHTFDGHNWLFRSLEVELESGHVYALTGPSGSGKSTFLSIVANWMQPSEGSVDRPPNFNVCWVFQNPHGVAKRTARDHVALPLLAQGSRPRDADRRAAELMDRFALSRMAKRSFSDLSGGEAQRLMLARGIATDPDVLLVDEPTAQLDRSAARAVNHVIAETAQEGTIVVVATHDLETRDACTDVIDLTRLGMMTDSGGRSNR